MNWVLIIPLIIAITFFVIAELIKSNNLDKVNKRTKSKTVEYKYQKTETLFSPAERSFLGVLDQAVGENAKIFGKVRVADVVTPPKGLSRSDWQIAFNKISGKHFDFLLCDKNDLSIKCAIELDDNSHKYKNRKRRDEFLKKACDNAGVPLIQVPAKTGYVIDDIKQKITPYFITKGKSNG